MQFRFADIRVGQPIPSLRNTHVRWRPTLSLGLARPDGGGRTFLDAHLDTGADDVIFPEWKAEEIGVRLSGAPTLRCRTATGRPFVIRYAAAELTLYAALDHFVRWRAVVGFAPVSSTVFGFAGGLQFFHAAFDFTTRQFTLVPRTNLPATDSRFPESTW